MEPYTKINVLFWLAFVAYNGDLSYQLWFNDEIENVTPNEAFNSFYNANYCCYPVICLN